MAYIVDPVLRARARAKAARLYPRSTVVGGQFLVRSRSRSFDHVVSVSDGMVVNCSGCPSFEHRNVCIHMGAVLNRLDRERKNLTPLTRKRQPVRKARWTDPLHV